MNSPSCPTARPAKLRRADFGFWKCRCCKEPLPEWSPYQRACESCRALAVRLAELHGGKTFTVRASDATDPDRERRIERYTRRAERGVGLFRPRDRARRGDDQ